MKTTVVISGSARKTGHTGTIARRISEQLKVPLIHLSDYHITPFDYDHKNQPDDFMSLIHHIIREYNYIIFATPVYWYAMSGIMKTFFDRITDLLTIEKETGRKLKGKQAGVVTSSVGDHLEDHFWLPFKKTFDYLGMELILKMHFFEDKISEEELMIISSSSSH